MAVINWNGREVLPGMLDSLLPQLGETSSRLVVFDNASEDGSAELAEEYCGRTEAASLVRNQVNSGFGAAADSIILSAGEPIVVLVNSDTIFRPCALERLLSSIESRPDVGLAGPRLLWPDGRLQPSQRDFPFPGNLLREHLPFLRNRTARYCEHDAGANPDWLVGAVMAVRVKAFVDSGGFSRDFGFFHEETDLMYRMAGQGWRVWFEPAAEVVHLCGHSTSRIYDGPIEDRYIPAKLLFLRKYGGPFSIPAFRFMMTGLLTARALGSHLRPLSGGRRDAGGRCFNRRMRAVWRAPRPGEGHPSRGREGSAGPGDDMGGTP